MMLQSLDMEAFETFLHHNLTERLFFIRRPRTLLFGGKSYAFGRHEIFNQYYR